MITETLTKEKKIKILKDIQSGRKAIRDILPPILEIWWEVTAHRSRSQYERESNPNPDFDEVLDTAIADTKKDRVQRFILGCEVLTRAQLSEKIKNDKRNITYISVVYEVPADEVQFRN